MSVTLQEVLESSGYKLTEKEDAIWLLSKRNEFEELVEAAENLLDALEEETL